MAKTDSTAPATKADIKALIDSIGKLYDANERWKDEIIRHFDVVVESIRHDLEGAMDDALSLTQDKYGQRIDRLEARVGISD